jgi:hypothetical protein
MRTAPVRRHRLGASANRALGSMIPWYRSRYRRSCDTIVQYRARVESRMLGVVDANGVTLDEKRSRGLRD